MIDKTTNKVPDSLAVQRRFDACIQRRNRVEFIVGCAVMALLIVSGAIGFMRSAILADTIAALGLILVAVGLGATLLRLNRHVAVQRREAANTSPKAALAGQLRRERDLLRSVWVWYIGPMLPGFVMVWGGMLAGGSVATALVGIAVTVIAVAFVAHANRRAAEAFDSQLRKLDPAPG